MSEDKNKRMPNQELPGSYPYVLTYQGRDGFWQREDSEKHTFAMGDRHGNYFEWDEKGVKVHAKGTHHVYSQGGMTVTSDQSMHTKVGGASATQVQGDVLSEAGGSRTSATGGDSTSVTKGTHFQHATGGNIQTSDGDSVSDHNAGSSFHNVKGDDVKFIGGSHYRQVSGDIGLHSTEGSLDFKVSGPQKKVRIVSGDDVIILQCKRLIARIGTEETGYTEVILA